ncbi:LysR family transcriptional regulator [Agreia sp.]|uniref:LysR family transcriptional regulator n=1 Tax=Agreia sp. TaxID=1872416 RepID=UPI0035BC8B3D
MDLNLLTALDALIEHESVQGAAAALHLTPPAMSHTLRRLREATKDDILVRNGRHMVPTARALALRDEVRDLVARTRSVLAPPGPLDLASLTRSFTIRGNDGLIAALAPPLLAEISSTAPHVVVVFLGEQPVDGHDLARGTADIEVGGERSVSASIRSTTIGHDDLAVVMRPGHPLAEHGSLSVEQFAAADHVVVSRRGRVHGAIDEALAGFDLHRRVTASLPSAAIALDVVLAGDAITVLARRLVGTSNPVILREVPLDLEPVTAIASWHRRHDNDPAHHWLRGRVSAHLGDMLA